MHRLLVEAAELESDAPVLSDEARNHLRVLRPREGEPIELFDGRGGRRACVWRGGALVPGGACVRAPRPVCGLTLFACVTKGSRWDWTIEKATELGATRIVPVISDRTIVRIAPPERAAKRARWLRIAEDAARQSDAVWVPDVLEPVGFDASIPLVRATCGFVGALTTPPPERFAAALARLEGPFAGRDFSVFVGPEGDFTPEELAALLAVATPVSFGDTILRAETAAIFGLGVLKAFLDVRAR